MLVKNASFATTLPSTMIQIREDRKPSVFPFKNAYEMVYGDENTTFEPLNL